MPVVHVVAELDAVAQDVELHESANDACRLSALEFLARAGPYDLHIHARIAEEDVFVAAEVGRVALVLELLFGDGRDGAHVAEHRSVFLPHHDVAVQERLYGFHLFVLLLGVGLGLRAGSEVGRQREEQDGRECVEK